MLKILYIMGAGRSGSTIVGVILGNCDDFFYAGELDAWLRNRGQPSYQSPPTIDLWSRIGSRLVRYQELFGDRMLRSVEHSSAILRPGYAFERHLRKTYLLFNHDLFNTISDETSTKTIIDSSHYPLRARQIRSLANIDLYLIYVVREPEAVVDSFRNTTGSGGKGLVGANLYLWYTHLVCMLVYLTHPKGKRALIQYEDILENPTMINTLVNLTGARSTLISETLNTGRPFAGNRLLASETVRLRRDAPIGIRRSWVTRMIQSPWILAVKAICLKPPRA